MSIQFKIRIEKLEDNNNNVTHYAEAFITQDILLHLAKTHNIDGIDEIYKIAKEQFWDNVKRVNEPSYD